MATSWTTAQVLALAPDTSSAKSGQDLSARRKWVTIGANDQAIWGECQGSGSKPYQAQIDLSEPAFKCSCPSRKFPCKHGLGLFLLHVQSPTEFTETNAPTWVSDWLASRSQKAEQRSQKAEAVAAAPPDLAAQAKKAAQREAKVTAGLQDLDLWLQDVIRHGLSDATSKPYSFWDGPAARLVDAQAPGLARMVRELAGMASSGAGWQGRLLERLSRVALVVEGYKNRETLPPDVLADLRSLIGWTQNQADLISNEGISDKWQILGCKIADEDRLRVRRTWLRGSVTGQAALLLDFAHGTSPFELGFVPGTVQDAELVYFPSALPLRAVIKTRSGTPTTSELLTGHETISQALGEYAAALARNPWLLNFPLTLESVTLAIVDGKWLLRDRNDFVLPIASQWDRGWHLLAQSGGHQMTVFGEWDGDVFLPLSVFVHGEFVTV